MYIRWTRVETVSKGMREVELAYFYQSYDAVCKRQKDGYAGLSKRDERTVEDKVDGRRRKKREKARMNIKRDEM